MDTMVILDGFFSEIQDTEEWLMSLDIREDCDLIGKLQIVLDGLTQGLIRFLKQEEIDLDKVTWFRCKF